MPNTVEDSNNEINTKRDILISKKLSKLLRHKALSLGFKIDKNGFVNVNEILQYNELKSLKVTLNDLKRIVNSNDKKRFKLISNNDNEFFISALQGHSISNINQTFQMIELDKNNDNDWPDFICHGTFKNKLLLIKNSNGLSKMNRNHIHFSFTIPDKFQKFIKNENNNNNNSYNHNAISGIRSNSNVLLILNIEKIRNSNLKFYKSLNDVILSPGDENGLINLNYIDKIIDLNNGLINWNDII